MLFNYPGAVATDPEGEPEARRLGLGPGDDERSIVAKPVGRPGAPLRLAFVGAGNYASSMLLPHLQEREDVALTQVVTTSALSASNAQRKFGFATATTDLDAVLDDPDVDVVFVVTRHNSHAALTRAGAAGRQGGVRREAAGARRDRARRRAVRRRGDRQRPAAGRLQPPLRPAADRSAHPPRSPRRPRDGPLPGQRGPARARQLVRAPRTPRARGSSARAATSWTR